MYSRRNPLPSNVALSSQHQPRTPASTSIRAQGLMSFLQKRRPAVTRDSPLSWRAVPSLPRGCTYCWHQWRAVNTWRIAFWGEG
jgi:hypothetical protein